MSAVFVTNLKFTPAVIEQVADGLAGWVRFTLNDLVVMRAAVRVSLDGVKYLAFETTVGGDGRHRAPSHPAHAAARASIESAVFDALKRRGRP